MQPPSKIKRTILALDLYTRYAVAVPKKKLPPEALAFFRKQGSIGGKKAASNLTPEQRSERSRKAARAMTPEQRSERARKAVAAREAKRRKNKKN